MMTRHKPMAASDLLAHTAFVTAMARGVLGRDGETEDVVQETWLAALRGTGPRKPGALRSWLGSISRRRAQDLRRKQATRARAERNAHRTGLSPSTAELAARAEVGRTMVSSLLALPEPYREVLLLRYYEELRPREIAARLDVPVETVRTRHRRALEQMRARLTASKGGDARAWAAVLLRWVGPGTSVPVAPLWGGIGVALALLLLAGAGLGAFLWLRGSDEEQSGTVTAVTPLRPDEQRPVLDGLPDEDEPPAADDLAGKEEPESPAPPSGHTVSGFVRDAEGRPVMGIPVRYSLKRPRKEGAPWSKDDWRLSEAYTDAKGVYRIEGLATGALWLNLLSERGFGPSHEVDHDLEADWTHDFVVQGALQFAGRVIVPGGEPARLWLDFREEQPGGAWGNVWGVRKLTLPPDGRFAFTAMRPGVYGLHVQAEGAAKYEARLELLENTLDHEIRLHAGRTLEVSLVLPEGLETARPSRFWLRPTAGGWQRTGTFDEKGRVRLESLPEGACTFYVRVHQKEGEAYRELLIERTVPVEIGAGTSSLELAIVKDEEIGLHVTTPDGASGLRGVLHVQGSPAGKVAVPFQVEPKADGTQRTVWPGIDSTWPPQRRTTEAGSLRIPGLPPGEYGVRIEATGYEPYVARLRVDGPAQLEVQLRPRRGQLIRTSIKSRYYRIQARPAGAAPDEWEQILWRDARVMISGHMPPGVREAFLGPGRYEFRLISREFMEARTGPLEVRDDGPPLVLTFDTWPGARVHGRVLTGGSAGHGPNLLLHLFRLQDGTELVRLEPKEAHGRDGRFEIRGLAPGTYTLSGSITGTPPLATFVVEDEDVRVDVTLPGAAGALDADVVEPNPSAPAAPERPDR